MNFEKVENLNRDDVMRIYDDVLEFGDDDTRLAGCCCSGGGSDEYYLRSVCFFWCRSRGWSCTGWNNTNSFPYYCRHRCIQPPDVHVLFLFTKKTIKL